MGNSQHLPRPEIIYHYCSASTFMNIVQSGCLWLTDVRLMNDFTEEIWAERKVYEAHILRRKDPNASAFFREEYHRKFKSSLMASRNFIACFSESNDSLSQWRAYADDGAGVAIGFSVPNLNVKHSSPRSSFSKGDGFYLAPVIYDERIQEEIIASYLDKDLQGEEGTSLGFAHLSFLAITMKNPGFAEEKELRIILKPAIFEANLNNSTEQCFFRNTARGISPYFTFNFSPASLVSVVLGPKNQTEPNDISLFLKKYNYPNMENISKSSVTYRG